MTSFVRPVPPLPVLNPDHAQHVVQFQSSMESSFERMCLKPKERIAKATFIINRLHSDHAFDAFSRCTRELTSDFPLDTWDLTVELFANRAAQIYNYDRTLFETLQFLSATATRDGQLHELNVYKALTDSPYGNDVYLGYKEGKQQIDVLWQISAQLVIVETKLTPSKSPKNKRQKASLRAIAKSYEGAVLYIYRDSQISKNQLTTSRLMKLLADPACFDLLAPYLIT